MKLEERRTPSTLSSHLRKPEISKVPTSIFESIIHRSFSYTRIRDKRTRTKTNIYVFHIYGFPDNPSRNNICRFRLVCSFPGITQAVSGQHSPVFSHMASPSSLHLLTISYSLAVGQVVDRQENIGNITENNNAYFSVPISTIFQSKTFNMIKNLCTLKQKFQE